MKWAQIPYSFLGMRKSSEYSEDERTTPRGFRGKYVFVYPFVKSRAWYALPAEERWRIMQGHITVGREYPGVDNHTTYSFGLDDQEFVVAFDTDDVGTFLDLVQRLRTTEASALHGARHAELHLPGDVAPARAERARRRAGVIRGGPRCLTAASPNCAAAIRSWRADRGGRQAAERARGTPGHGRPLRRAGAHDRRPAAERERGARDLRAADGALRRPGADAAGDPRRQARRAARRRGALAREGRATCARSPSTRSRANWSSSG